AELLSAVPKNKQTDVSQFFDKNFIVAPFDSLAAEKCGELINLCLTDQKQQDFLVEQRVPRNEIKFDCMLVAIAITKRAHKIYSDDKHLKKFACGQIDVVNMPIIPVQQKLEFKMRGGETQPTDNDEPF
ncbi:MAG TPA: hypothetical protein VIJ27_00720, partial [Mucilaginibacter sp.]